MKMRIEKNINESTNYNLYTNDELLDIISNNECDFTLVIRDNFGSDKYVMSLTYSLLHKRITECECINEFELSLEQTIRANEISKLLSIELEKACEFIVSMI